MFIIIAQFGFSLPSVYHEVASVLRDRGHEVWVAKRDESGVLVFHDGSQIVAKLNKPVIPPHKFFAFPGINLLAHWTVEWVFSMRLRRFIRKSQPDVIQMNRAKLTFFWLIPLLAKRSTRYVLDWRQIVEREYHGLLGTVKRFFFKQYRRIPSRYIYDQACFLHPAGAKQVLGDQWQRWATVVPLAVSANFLQCAPGNKENESSVRFIYIGTLSRARRLDRMILAAQKIRLAAKDGNDFEISFIGPDKSDGLYEEMIEELDLSPVVSIKPPVPYQDIPNILSQYDVALAIVPEYPLDWQYHPTLKVLEYRALGMPIIATDFEPNREVVQDGVNGLLVSNSPDNIAQAMQRFVKEDGFLRQCIVNAQAMRQGLLWQDIGEMYEQLYLRLLQH